ncbi:hypothetical protein CAC42_4905 [Sphaceloma murrayae]|uniref:Small-subunit processome Utp12 domain-containing protein n=1 Tax=Sphaceloma murrayae TaxID=2082308 RepID=A0A2K1QPK4_9PEZI|nr:hypothetical protein CAC42_4905 [Sphaceloma murrayae]
MSTTKRPRQRQADAGAASSLPPAKRTKFGRDTQEHPSSLAFLTDERQRSGKTIAAKLTNGADTARVNRLHESIPPISGEAVVDDSEAENGFSGADSDVSSSSEDPSSESDLGKDEEEVGEDTPLEPVANGTSKHGKDEALDKVADHEQEDDNTAGSRAVVALTNGVHDEERHSPEADVPSFGDMLQAAHPDVIDVAAFNGPDLSKAIVPSESSKTVQPVLTNSLGTVLTQALRTNDKELLETCLQIKDNASVKSTIQRLQSPLVATLMQKLAERLHKRPGRAGPLMVWVQWALVAHGGYLASQPQVVKKLRSLRQVVRERANSLQSLITLKGKLDMLSAQVELRRSMRAYRADRDESDDDDEADVIYVEGMDQDISSSDGEEDGGAAPRRILPNRRRGATIKDTNGHGSDVEMDGDVPLINGIDDDAEMESMGEEDQDDANGLGGLIDDEAEESDGAESISSQEESSGGESDEEEEEEEEGASGSSSDSDDEASAGPPPSKQRPLGKRNTLIRKR